MAKKKTSSVKVYSKTYTKTHKSPAAAKKHMAAIKKRNAVVQSSSAKGGTRLEYSFKK